MTPPTDTRSWQGTQDAGDMPGMEAARRRARATRSTLATSQSGIAGAVGSVFALSLLVLDPTVKFGGELPDRVVQPDAHPMRCCRARRSCAPWRASLCAEVHMMRAMRCIDDLVYVGEHG